MPPHAHAFCSILPPHILRKLADKAEMRDRVLRDIATNERLRGIRQVFAMPLLATQPGKKRRTIFDAKTTTDLPGTQVLDEGGPASADVAVTEAYNYSGDTYDFYLKVFNRNSVDDHGLTLISTVHYDQGYDNAFWNGQQMIYGDGDRTLFNRFTAAIDIIGHELTHGVTQYAAGLGYSGETGALNEHISDVFGILIKQYALEQPARHADWVIGRGLFTAAVNGMGLRSLSAPGTAYDDPVLGRDQQPAHMRDYVDSPEDNGGVHINSGIPNHAFYQAAIGLGGYSWTVAGPIWYEAAIHRLSARSQFQDCANATVAVAGELYGEGGQGQQIVRYAWAKVGIIVPSTPTKASAARAAKQAAAKLWRNRPAIAMSH